MRQPTIACHGDQASSPMGWRTHFAASDAVRRTCRLKSRLNWAGPAETTNAATSAIVRSRRAIISRSSWSRIAFTYRIGFLARQRLEMDVVGGSAHACVACQSGDGNPGTVAFPRSGEAVHDPPGRAALTLDKMILAEAAKGHFWAAPVAGRVSCTSSGPSALPRDAPAGSSGSTGRHGARSPAGARTRRH